MGLERWRRGNLEREKRQQMCYVFIYAMRMYLCKQTWECSRVREAEEGYLVTRPNDPITGVEVEVNSRTPVQGPTTMIIVIMAEMKTIATMIMTTTMTIKRARDFGSMCVQTNCRGGTKYREKKEISRTFR